MSPRLYDRSRVEEDWNCPRARYWMYEYGGRGIVSSNTSLAFYEGLTVHDALAAIAQMHKGGAVVDIDAIAAAAHKQLLDALLTEGGEVDEVDYANEQATLVEGIVRGFYKHMWPKLIAQFPNLLCIEEEMRYEHDGLVFMSRPDLIASDTEGNCCYVEYKTTSSKKDDWISSWDTAAQLHSTIKAVKFTTGLDVDQVIVQGLYKGYQSYGKQNSPFCYAYVNEGKPPAMIRQVQYEYKAGFKRYPVWQMDGGVKAWVEGMPAELLADQFPQCPPIFVKEELVTRFFRQCLWREKEIDLACSMLEGADEESRQEILDVAFPQRFSRCKPAWGYPCDFRRMCHGHIEEPLNEGWQWREPHHQLEVEKFKNEGVNANTNS